VGVAPVQQANLIHLPRKVAGVSKTRRRIPRLPE